MEKLGNESVSGIDRVLFSFLFSKKFNVVNLKFDANFFEKNRISLLLLIFQDIPNTLNTPRL